METFQNDQEAVQIDTDTSIMDSLLSEKPKSGIKFIDIQNEQTYFDMSLVKSIRKNIKKGNIIPDGEMEPTPDGIKIELKVHQKRMLHEMLVKESLNYRISSRINAFCIADKVGAGKSYEVLSLITKNPIVNNFGNNKLIYKPHIYSDYTTLEFANTIELKTNLIVVPHGIYNQWLNYIVKFTNLTYIGIGFKRDISKINYDEIKDGKYNIILVKSTRYNDLLNDIYKSFPKVSNCITYKDDLFDEKMRENIFNIKIFADDVYKNISNNEFDDNFLNNIQNLKNNLEKFNMKNFKEQRIKQGLYTPNYILKYSGPIFERVFIDEANSIKIPKCQYAYGKYNWFITSSVEDLLVPTGKKNYYSNKILINGIKGSGFIKETFLHNMDTRKYGSIQDMFLKNRDDFVVESFQLPEPIFTKHSCYTPPEITALQNVGMPEVIHALNAGDVKSAINQVGCQVKDNESIVELVLTNINEELIGRKTVLETKKIKLESCIIEINQIKSDMDDYKQQMNEENISNTEYNFYQEQIHILLESLTNVNNKKSSIKASIKNYDKKIKDLESKATSLTERISNIESKSCPVCMQIVSNACMTPCCKNIFCFQCLALSCNYNNNTCPLCRTKINMKNVTAISTDVLETNDIDNVKLPTKLENLIKIINDNPGGRFLVFSEFDNSFNNIEIELKKNNISFSKLSGSSGRVTNIIKDFSQNQIQVLLLNAKNYGSGLNLQMTTHIILFHRMSNDLEKQIIGRGQRLGRTTRLSVNYLCYENEM